MPGRAALFLLRGNGGSTRQAVLPQVMQAFPSAARNATFISEAQVLAPPVPSLLRRSGITPRSSWHFYTYILLLYQGFAPASSSLRFFGVLHKQRLDFFTQALAPAAPSAAAGCPDFRFGKPACLPQDARFPANAANRRQSSAKTGICGSNGTSGIFRHFAQARPAPKRLTKAPLL